jgi:nicotinate-nucleotide adenylyltransferase
VLLVGADAFAGLSAWHRWRELFDHAHIGVLTRPGHGEAFEPEVAGEWFSRRVAAAAALHAAPAGAVLPIGVTPLEISGSQIRGLVAAGRSPGFLVPERVARYIGSIGLYRNPDPR